MIDFSVLSSEQAQAYCDTYSQQIPDRTAWLQKEMVVTGIELKHKMPADLEIIWAWAWPRIQGLDKLSNPPAGRPMWYSTDRSNPHLSDAALWLIDALGCYLIEIIKSHYTGTYLGVYKPDKRYRDIDENRTMLMGLPRGRPADPTRMVYGEVIAVIVHGESYNAHALSHIYKELIRPAPQ